MNEQKIGTLVGGMVGLFPIEITELLTQNGVVVDTINLNIDNLVTATIYALDTSVSFRKDFINLYFSNEELINSKIETEDYSNFLGFGKNKTTSTTSTKTGGGSTFDYGGVATSLIGGIGGFLGSKNDLKSAQAQADAMIKSGELSLEAQRLALEGKKIDAQTALALASAKPQGNTMLYVALGIGGVLILGVVIWAVTRKRA
jgi:hypothetical protein